MEENDKKNHFLLPALISAAAVYFGLRKNSEKLGNITKSAVSMAIDDQLKRIEKNQPNAKTKLLLPYRSRGKRRRK